MNATRLVSRAYLEGQQRGIPTIDRSWLTAENLSGLIAISGAMEGDVGRALVNGKEKRRRPGADALARAVRRPLLHRAAACWAGPAKSRTSRRPCRSRRSAACPSSRPTTCASSSRTISSRTKRASASTTARCWVTQSRPRKYTQPAIPALAEGNGRAVLGHSRGPQQLRGNRAPLQPRAEAG